MPDATPRDPSAGSGGPPSAAPLLDGQRRPRAVLLDFHGTIVQVEPAERWVRLAAAACSTDLPADRCAGLADALVTAGRAGGPRPGRIPPELAEAYADRDLSEPAHRAAYTGLAATVDTGIDGLPDALYERLLDPDGWRIYPDTLPMLRALRAAGVPVAVVSNIGFDVLPIATALGFADLIDHWLLSYQLGTCKPDPAIFRRGCAAVRHEPEQTLMVGDTPADAAAAAIGCPTLVLPATEPDQVHGLAAVLHLLGITA
ncbi:HAD family hydrolase [Actinocatenispora comari]|uniref:Hydrolase n=1 Tax=Actinocatenispora comari TaxID=2807577 RepID=A0A8J4EN06_9ACTN|nr:hydrolase [Actinocatenispora comari]